MTNPPTPTIEAIARIIAPATWSYHDHALRPYVENRAATGTLEWMYRDTRRAGCRTVEDVLNWLFVTPLPDNGGVDLNRFALRESVRKAQEILTIRIEADLRAATAVGFKAGLEAAAARIVRLRANAKWAPAIDRRYKDGAFDGWAAAHIALTALTPPSDLDEALATALEQARMEGRKEEREARIEHAPANKVLAWLALHSECGADTSTE